MQTNHENHRAEYVTRDSILKLLSDAEVARVAMAETAEKLKEDDEYVDLTQLGEGVQRSAHARTNVGHVLLRASVQQDTWVKILAQLATFRAQSKR